MFSIPVNRLFQSKSFVKIKKMISEFSLYGNKPTVVPIVKDNDATVILLQSHYQETINGMKDAISNALNDNSSQIKFGIAYTEAHGKCSVQQSGNDEHYVSMAVFNAKRLSVGQLVVICIQNGFPNSVLTAIKNVPEVLRIYCATANPTEVLVAVVGKEIPENAVKRDILGRGIVAVIDGFSVPPLEKKYTVDQHLEMDRERREYIKGNSQNCIIN